jgi:hypothetical protein
VLKTTLSFDWTLASHCAVSFFFLTGFRLQRNKTATRRKVLIRLLYTRWVLTSKRNQNRIQTRKHSPRPSSVHLLRRSLPITLPLFRLNLLKVRTRDKVPKCLIVRSSRERNFLFVNLDRLHEGRRRVGRVRAEGVETGGGGEGEEVHFALFFEEEVGGYC